MLARHGFGTALVLLVAVTAGGSAEQQSGIAIVAPGKSVNLAPADLAQLPPTKLSISYKSENGMRSAFFEGPLLWSVLEKIGVIDPQMHREQVSQTILITGRDGYRAVLAVGEIAPEFEAKQVILADQVNGKPLDAEHLRVVVPLDKRGGRSVRDVVRIELTAPAAMQ